MSLLDSPTARARFDGMKNGLEASRAFLRLVHDDQWLAGIGRYSLAESRRHSTLLRRKLELEHVELGGEGGGA